MTIHAGHGIAVTSDKAGQKASETTKSWDAYHFSRGQWSAMYRVPIEAPVVKKQGLLSIHLTEERIMSKHNPKLTYTANGDCFIPNIAFSVAATETLGKHGRLRKTYPQEHRPGLFNRRGYYLWGMKTRLQRHDCKCHGCHREQNRWE